MGDLYQPAMVSHSSMGYFHIPCELCICTRVLVEVVLLMDLFHIILLDLFQI